MTADLLLPAVAMAFLGWLVPRALFRCFHESICGLAYLTGVSSVLMTAIAALIYAGLYTLGGTSLSLATPDVIHLTKLGLISGLIWLPPLLLSVMGLPKYRENATW